MDNPNPNQPMQNIPPQPTQPLQPQQPPTGNTPPSAPPTPTEKQKTVPTILVIFLLFFVYPIGLFFMFLGTKWPKWAKILALSPIILGILAVVLSIFLISQDPLHRFNNNPVVSTSPAPTVTDISNWKTYKDTFGGFEFKYPSELENEVAHIATTSSKQNIVNQYQELKTTGCPSTCGQLTLDPMLLQKQFDLLEQVNTFPSCKLTESYIDDFSKNFILFTGGIGHKIEVKGIMIDGICAVKYIEEDGFAADLSNFEYKIAFIKDDKITGIILSIFPHNVFEKVNTFYESMGDKNECDQECYKKEVGAYKNFSVTKSPADFVISTYDKIFSTFKFTK